MRNIMISSTVDVNNLVDTRTIYPEAQGSSLGTRGSALTPFTAAGYKNVPTVQPNPGVQVPRAAGRGGDRSAAGAQTGTSGVGSMAPLMVFVILVVLLVALMWVAQRFGSEKEDFKSIKLSIYNVIVIALAAAVGFGLFKMVFGRVYIPGVSDYFTAI